MKINDLNHLGVGAADAAQQAGAAEGRPAGRGKPDRVGGQDRTELSGAAEIAVQEASGSSPERVTRVSELRELVKTGRYQVDAAQVAGKIVDDALGAGRGDSGGDH